MNAEATTAPPEPSSIRLAATLGVAGLIAGLALVAAYELTLPRIEANKARALRRAVKQVVPGATKMQPLINDHGTLRVAGDDDKGPRVYAAYDDAGTFRGYAIPSQGAGFQDRIVLIFGYDPDTRRATGMKVLESRETPGLGDKIFKDKGFVGQFDTLTLNPKVVVRKGGEIAANEIHAITGATISSKAVVKIVNQANKRWRDVLPKAASAPAYKAPQAGGGTKR